MGSSDRSGDLPRTGHPNPAAEREATRDVLDAVHDEFEPGAAEALLQLVGHEIRTPLSIIEAGTRLLVEDAEGADGETASIARQVHSNALLALLLLQRLIEVGRVDRGDLALQKHPVDVARLTEVTVGELHDVVLGTRSAEVRVEAGIPGSCRADPSRLRQVLFNLLANAALNTPPDAPIFVTVRAPGDAVEIEVRDDGHGVAEEDAEELFEKFPRLSASRQGPSLGLYVSRAITRAHGGDLRAVPVPEESEDGGIFVLTLPCGSGT
jgi:two-component system, OmpR family, sensor kinase